MTLLKVFFQIIVDLSRLNNLSIIMQSVVDNNLYVKGYKRTKIINFYHIFI